MRRCLRAAAIGVVIVAGLGCGGGTTSDGGMGGGAGHGGAGGLGGIGGRAGSAGGAGAGGVRATGGASADAGADASATGGVGGGTGGGAGGASGAAGAAAGAGGEAGSAGGRAGSAGGAAGSAGGAAGSASGGGGAAGGAGGAPFCPSDMLVCTSGDPATCHPGSFTFESGTTEGFAVDPMVSPADTTLSVSTTVAHGGTHSLALTVDAPNGSQGAYAKLPLCGPGQWTDLQGATVSVWIYLDGSTPLPNPLTSYASIGIWVNPNQEPNVQPRSNVALDTWVHLTVLVPPYNVTGPAGELTSYAINVGFFVNQTPGWSGTLYIDDLTISFPSM